tara:strand:- start:428266 stop:430656 length:2391 start_codon:yes stop_codon:yes gene_type:complete
MASISCYHCGDSCDSAVVYLNNNAFCCNGCKTVYEILNENDLSSYYDFEDAPGKSPKEIKGKYDYLDSDQITEKLYDFKDNKVSVITFYIPHIHCSSCIWVLEHLNKLNTAISTSQVNFPKKQVRITFDSSGISLKTLVILLNSIGYEPYISLEDTTKKKQKINRSLIYKLAITGFAFGNIMLLSFPEYFQTDDFWLEKYKSLFRTIIFITILPVVFYAANDYFISAYKGLRHKILNIDVPIALGISVLFLRSTYEMVYDVGQGYMDSLAGFVFFLLLGKIFQEQTYSFLSFERDYKSYFPIAVTKIKGKMESTISVYAIKKGDRLLVRNNELIPVDGVLISNNAQLDYSFVTGESLPLDKKSGDKIYAGGRQISGAIEMEVLQTVSQSYLTQLWSNSIFTKGRPSAIKNLTDRISKQFTIVVLIIATLAGVFWYFKDAGSVAQVVTAVLIVACPCALALSAPFALGNMLRIFGKEKIYLKNTDVIEQLSHINTVIFDKTGTITTAQTNILFQGSPLSSEEKVGVKSVLRASNHPLSRMIYSDLKAVDFLKVEAFKETTGKGIEGMVNGDTIRLGSASFVGAKKANHMQTVVYVSINGNAKGYFVFENSYRTDLDKLFKKLASNYQLGILSGDNEGEKDTLKSLLPKGTTMIFNQKPTDKLKYIEHLQKKGQRVLMVGDGLNDAGALAQSNVGLAIAEDINVFSPASDGIVDASKFSQLERILKLSKATLSIVKMSFVISLLYNLIGMYFAVTGQLSPIIAAILMPLSSISIVVFVTITTNLIAKKKMKHDKYHIF